MGRSSSACRGSIVVLSSLLVFRAAAQEGGQIHGNFSTDVQYYNQDSAIGAVVGMLLGWCVSWRYARQIPRDV